MSLIEVNHIHKNFKIAEPTKGVMGSLKSLLKKKYYTKVAVEDISFQIDRGEVVGYIGPNGAGKSTTIKILSGVLTPTSGSVTVNGIIPYKNRKENALKIGVVFGQRSQLYWDLPVADTFELYQKLYNIKDDLYNTNRRYFTDILEMHDFINQPVRQLSLGQKMKANLALSMLHDPDILYLDEPTIGLDVMSKKTLRTCIADINRDKQTTIILTTHDMDDIEAVCGRLILIDKGRKLFDGSLTDFEEHYKNGYLVRMQFERNLPVWGAEKNYKLLEQSENNFVISVDKCLTTREALTYLINRYNPDNIYIEKEKIEDIIQKIFTN
ncbi:ATP-binding cassette domain-containing protein [Anaerocolumna sedimenticola]|uniref:ATP-binding cassette domain-containing protein n=1 Tax=Anaerocolumna sedimenticola TaxID=2696063 RepID=A0A6P1TKI6_9FIRM|nr:ATP-binding cassette domain-containing protein [Anaerocolumna sedimenticola]QHQ60155.1 ATP-binding cassette domain-containing protein [Anaerocolumna sedimenticola]